MRLHLYFSMPLPALLLAACMTGEQAAPVDRADYGQVDFNLTAPNGRDVQARAFLPAEDCSPCALIIFSHGAYAAFDRYDVLLSDWAARGYAVVAPQHVDSEDHPRHDAYSMDESRPARLADYALVSSTFAAEGYTLDGVTFSGRQIAAGHSYGGLIAQVAGGASLANSAYTKPGNARAPEAVIALSPPGEIDGLVTMDGFSGIETPMLVVTGTTDRLPGFIDDWQSHLDGYQAAPAALAYALVYEGMDHYFNGAFGRETTEGASAMPAVKDLNARIATFIEDAFADTLPTGLDWRASGSDLVEARTRRGDLT